MKIGLSVMNYKIQVTRKFELSTDSGSFPYLGLPSGITKRACGWKTGNGFV